jgi:PAS domain S-box-containing protein
VNRPRVRQREVGQLWVALFILGGVATLAYRSVGAAADTLGWVEHANQVIQQIGEVNSAYARTVSARRTYVVAGDASQLGDAPDLDARLARAVATVRASLTDNPTQIRRLDKLSELLDERLADLGRAVEQRQRTGSGLESADGVALTARIRAVREEMETEENRLLAERDARTRRDLGRTKLAEVLGTLVSFAILLFAFGRLRQEVALRRVSEEALRRSEGFLDSIVENIPDMIFVKEAGELRFERINRAGEELLAIDRKDLIRKNDFDFFPREQAEAFQARDRATLAARTIIDIPEEPIQTKGGERWLHTKKVPVIDENGVPRYLLGISEDITERRKEAAALKSAKDAAVAANLELEAFSYSVAHDLRAPLRAIDGFSQALEEDCADKLDAAGVDYLKRVRTSAQHMGQLIDGLLGLSRLTRGAVVREKLDLSRIARESGARLRELNPDRPVELVVGDKLDAEGDLRLLTSVFDNLLGNAWKFTGKREHPRVEVGQTTEDGRAVFFVRDNGAGFDQTYAHKLFGTFQRLHGASEFEGSGIGLATVQRIIRRHGGRVWAEGEVDRGATLYFTL